MKEGSARIRQSGCKSKKQLSKSKKHYLLSCSTQPGDSLSSNLSKRLICSWRLWQALWIRRSKDFWTTVLFQQAWHKSLLLFLRHRFHWLPNNSFSWFSNFLAVPCFSSPWPLNVKCCRFYPWSTSQSTILSRQAHPIAWHLLHLYLHCLSWTPDSYIYQLWDTFHSCLKHMKNQTHDVSPTCFPIISPISVNGNSILPGDQTKSLGIISLLLFLCHLTMNPLISPKKHPESNHFP